MRPTLTDLNNLEDPMPAMNFEFLLGNLPAGLNADKLAIKCQTASIPGSSIEPMEMALHGQVLRFPGRKIYPGTMSCTFVEESNMGTQRVLRTWMEKIKSSDTSKSSGYKRDVAVQARLNVYDTTNTLKDEIDIFGLWLSELSDIQLDGQSSQIMLVQATFTYDTWRSNNHPFE